ncbi:MAG: S-layer homology domain-containing protein [bacterium]
MRTAMTVLLTLALIAPAWAEIFSDISGHPAQRAIERLAAKGVVGGVAPGRFQPGEGVNRLQMVLFMVRLLGISGQGVKPPAFKDLAEIPETARAAVAASVGIGSVSSTSAELKKGTITYTLTTDKAAYGPDEQILLTFVITNAGKDEIKFEHANSQWHDFIVTASDGSEVARWSLGRAFLPENKPVALAAGKSFNFNTRWKQFDQNDRPVPTGRYEITAVHTTKTNPTSLSLFFQKGLVVGYPDNTFRPNQPVSRAELAAMTVRAGGLDTEAFARAKATLPVSDNGEVLDWARGSVAVAIERKMIPLVDGAFRPTRAASRADAATALDVIMGLLKRYDYTRGTLRSVGQGRPATITFEDEKNAARTFRVAAAHAVYRNERVVALADLKVGDKISMLKESDAGDVSYIEATGP